MVDNVRQDAKELLKNYRNVLFGAGLIIVLLNGFLSNLFGGMYMIDYFIQTLIYSLYAALQIMILYSYRQEIIPNLKELFGILKKHAMNLLMLGLMIEAVSYLITNIVFMFMGPLLIRVPNEFSLIVSVSISFLTMGIAHFVTYLFLFAPFYIVDKEMLPIDAFVRSFKDTKGHRLNMFGLELPYILILLSLMVTILVVGPIIPSQLVVSILLLFGSFLGVYFAVDLYTMRAIYYEQASEETIL